MATPISSRQSTLQQLAPFMGMGFELCAAMVLFGALGMWLDSQLNTKPWMMVGGLVFGAVGGMIRIIRKSIAYGKKNVLQKKSTADRG